MALVALRDKSAILHGIGEIELEDLQSVTASFKDGILLRLKKVLQEFETPSEDHCLLVYSIINALSSLGVEKSQLAGLKVENFASHANAFFAEQLVTFNVIHGPDDIGPEQLGGEVTRPLPIREKTRSILLGKSNQEKLDLLRDILDTGLERLDKLLVAREIIKSVEGTFAQHQRVRLETSTSISESISVEP